MLSEAIRLYRGLFFCSVIALFKIVVARSLVKMPMRCRSELGEKNISNGLMAVHGGLIDGCSRLNAILFLSDFVFLGGKRLMQFVANRRSMSK